MMSRTQEQAAVSGSDREVAVEALHSRLTISVEQAAVLLDIGRSTAYTAVRAGELHAIKIQGRWLVPTAPLRKMLWVDDD